MICTETQVIDMVSASEDGSASSLRVTLKRPRNTTVLAMMEILCNITDRKPEKTKEYNGFPRHWEC